MRVLRPIAITLAAACAVLVACGATVAQPAKIDPKPHLQNLATQIAETEVLLWRCNEQRGEPHAHVTTPPWSLPKSVPYRERVLRLWQHRLKACRTALHARDAIVGKLNRALYGTPMAGTGRELEAAGRRWHVHPAVIAGIAFTESTAGEQACSSDRHNAFGLASCIGYWGGSCRKCRKIYVPRFHSWADAYDFEARYLTGHTTVTTGWPWARTVYDLHGYAKCSACWSAKVATHMRHMGFGPDFRYP